MPRASPRRAFPRLPAAGPIEPPIGRGGPSGLGGRSSSIRSDPSHHPDDNWLEFICILQVCGLNRFKKGL